MNQQHISEVIDDYKTELNGYSKDYQKIILNLQNFLSKDKTDQQRMLEEIYGQHSELEGLLREIISEDINGTSTGTECNH